MVILTSIFIPHYIKLNQMPYSIPNIIIFLYLFSFLYLIAMVLLKSVHDKNLQKILEANGKLLIAELEHIKAEDNIFVNIFSSSSNSPFFLSFCL